jgi:DNA-binding NarL/FixJ family response regulator
MEKQIPIILADAQYLVRIGLRALLEREPQFQILSEATDEEELLELLKAHPARVVIMDYNQSGYFNTETVAKVKKASPQSNLLIISADDDKQNIYKVLENGVNSFITKSCDEQEIIDAIKAADRGEKFFCSKVLDYLLEKSFPKNEKDASCEPVPLSPREIEIVRLIAKGLIAKEIAEELNLSTHTIYTHRKNILKKLGLSTASELMVYAVKQGLLPSE